MRLFAFAGTRYAGGDGDPGAHAAPPYDQIDDERRRALHAADPHQFAHLSRPYPADGKDPAAHAAALHAAWRRDGVLERDPEPGLYPYEIRLAAGGRRLGLFGLVGLEEPAAGIIRPHEQTRSPRRWPSAWSSCGGWRSTSARSCSWPRTAAPSTSYWRPTWRGPLPWPSTATSSATGTAWSGSRTRSASGATAPPSPRPRG